LLNALGGGGGRDNTGAAKILLRAAVAGLLNASHPDVDYAGLSASALISAVANALASEDRATMISLAGSIDTDNNAGCSLGRGDDDDKDDDDDRGNRGNRGGRDDDDDDKDDDDKPRGNSRR
jgi:hypothetical protein